MTTNWIHHITDNYRAGVSNVFLLTGTVHDYVEPGVSLKEYLMKQLDDDTKAFYSHSVATGSQLLKGTAIEREGRRGDWEQMLADLRMDRKDGRVVYFIDYPEFLLAGSQNPDKETTYRLISLHQLMNDLAFITSKNMLILVSETKSGIHDMFLNANSRTIVVPIAYPDSEERLGMIHFLGATANKPFESELDDRQLANLTSGLSRMQIEDILLLAEASGVLTRQMVIRRKEELIRKEFGELIEFFDTEGYSLDRFAGQKQIIDYHREAVITPFATGDTSYVPKGLLYMGPPGTGKTYFARCLAGDAGINFVEFKMSKIVDKWVGTSERNLEKAFACFQSMAPVGVFIDEMDQVLSRGAEGESNPVRQNIFGMFLGFLSKPENRGKILWVGATNYPNKIDEALKRAGRFDKKIPFFAPSEEERVEILDLHLRRAGSQNAIGMDTIVRLAKEMDGSTPAEIENVVIKAVELANRRGLPGVDAELLVEAKGYMLPAQNARIEEMVDIALKEMNDLEFLTKEYRERAIRLHQGTT